ncbi:FadR/GntR family transcriptional regulator [Parasphingorhabdus halotolerans]|uniref:FadR family transcriptional regulator n=1 Tax=Parasphingorhabdus halotolerans TaxID=2725558 RepID=A0A6H2DR88_9SPHN|nr:FadR/GntR family transcriptional regulator [Parasphingorhabdus halotolerans]QJB70186.1 FadR family transcriptional regulator [Parasphingorhabdus halotolerans]
MSEKRLFHSVAEQITDLIREGVFPAGARLPGERELAERFGVSRVTIREAEIALQAIGRIEIKTGSGVYVCESQPEDESQLPDVSAFELTEARSLFEAEAAALAAQNISDEGIAKLGKFIKAMGSSDEDVSTEADQQFHITIAEASGNAAIVHTIKTLWRMREELPDVKAAYESICELDTSTRTNEHQEIYNALAARNPLAARQAMHSHFRRLIEAMLDATEKRAMEEVQQRANESRERFLTSAKIG